MIGRIELRHQDSQGTDTWHMENPGADDPCGQG